MGQYKFITNPLRSQPVSDAIDRVPKLGSKAAYAKQAIHEELIEHKTYIAKYGENMPKIRDWKWPGESK